MHTLSFLVPRLVVFTLALFVADTAWASPTKSIKRTNDKIAKLLKQTAPKGSSRAKKIDTQLTRTIGGFLDFDELARRALGKHWKTRSDAERKEFAKILRQLIERNYLKQMRSNLKYAVEYRKEETSGKKSRVVTVISMTKDGRKQEVVVEYKMHRVKSGWMVYDVLTDDSSIVRNYRSQFNRIIKRKSYKALVDKMRRKLEKLQKAS